MAVLVTAEVPGQTQQGYDGMMGVLADALKQAKGFILHTAHPIEGGWRVIEPVARHQAQTLVPGITQPCDGLTE